MDLREELERGKRLLENELAQLREESDDVRTRRDSTTDLLRSTEMEFQVSHNPDPFRY